MPLWGKKDLANNAPLFIGALVDVAPNTANRDNLFNNVTADAYKTGETLGVFAASVNSMAQQAFITITAAVANSYGTGTYLPGDVLTVANVNDSNTLVQATLNVAAVELATIVLNGPGTAGNYVPGEEIQVNTGTADPKGSANITATEVRTATPTAGNLGTGFANGDTVQLTDGAGANLGVFTVTTGVSNTSVASVALTNRGSFTTNPTLSASVAAKITGSGSGLKLDLTTRIKSITLKNRGSYTVVPTASAGATAMASGSTSDGTGATVDTTTRVKTLAIKNAGEFKIAGAIVNPTYNAVTGGSGSSLTVNLTTASGAGAAAGIAHPGWELRKVGSGNRAGRVQWETLVALKSVANTADDSGDQTVLPG